MSTKTIIIAWRFPEQSEKEIVFSFPDYELIKIDTPLGEDEKLSEKNAALFGYLKNKVLSISSDLFLFIHKTNFTTEEINTFKMRNDFRKNIYVETFEGGYSGYVYGKIINKNTGSINSFTAESIEVIFRELTIECGRMTVMEAKLIINKFLHVLKRKNSKITKYEAYNIILKQIKKRVRGFSLDQLLVEEKNQFLEWEGWENSNEAFNYDDIENLNLFR